VARFIEEAQVGAQLQHPNLPPVYEAGLLPDGRPWFAMKEVRGQTLSALVEEAHADDLTPATIRRLGDVFAKVCDGVGYAHARGVVHRDLKPDNVMVGGHGEVLVLDWGLAKVLGQPDRALADGDLEPEVASARSQDDAHRTRIGRVLGTAAYLAPEQARGDIDRLDADASDLADRLRQCDGVLVPGGFGGRGVEGKIEAARIAREEGIPYLGICLGLNTALMTRSDRLHDAVVADLKAEAQRDAAAYLKGATASAYTAGWAAAEESRVREGR
jgi:hypothetical protein